jgi:hypothetical protein
MEKNIRDYLHLYMGCKVETNINGKYVHPYGCLSIDVIDSDTYNTIIFNLKLSENDLEKGWVDNTHLYVKPILRPLSSITEDEKNEASAFIEPTNQFRLYSSGYTHYAKCTHFLLSNGFDLFGLIEAGLAIDATTLTNS